MLSLLGIGQEMIQLGHIGDFLLAICYLSYLLTFIMASPVCNHTNSELDVPFFPAPPTTFVVGSFVYVD